MTRCRTIRGGNRVTFASPLLGFNVFPFTNVNRIRKGSAKRPVILNRHLQLLQACFRTPSYVCAFSLFKNAAANASIYTCSPVITKLLNVGTIRSWNRSGVVIKMNLSQVGCIFCPFFASTFGVVIITTRIT